MSTTKNNKLKCIITGRQLIATKEYYARKVEKAGSEEQLHRTYVCREAKNLLKQGTTVEKIRQVLNADMSKVSDIPEDLLHGILDEIQTTKIKRINNIINISQTISTKTDPEVKQYIHNITK
jgi:hypothetical protein